MDTRMDDLVAKFYQFVKEKTGKDEPESKEQMESLLQEFQQQYNAGLSGRAALSRENARTVYDWLELSENQKTKKAERECLEKAKEVAPKNLDVLTRLMLLENKKDWEYLPEIREILAIGKEDLMERKLYRESMGDFYMVLETRPYMRAMHLYLEFLIHCHMIQQAITVAKEILKLNRNDNMGVRHTLMALYVYTEDEMGTQRLLRNFKGEEDCCFYSMSQALLKFRQGRWDEAKTILETVKKHYNGFMSFLRDAAAGRDAFYEEYFDEGYYQPFTRSELATMLMDHNFLWDTAQDFFQWAKKAMGPQHRKKA